MIRLFARRRALLAQLDAQQVKLLKTITDLGESEVDLDRARDIAVALENENARLIDQHGRDLALYRRAIAGYEGRLDQAVAECDRARATIAARLESTQRAGAEYDVRIATLTADRDRALAQAETARAAAEAADIPIRPGLEVDDYLAAMSAVLDAIAPPKAGDTRRRIYLDGTGHAWIDDCQDPDGTQYIAGIDASSGHYEAAEDVRKRTGGLRVIGATQ